MVDQLFDFKLEFINHWLELDVDAIYFLDDWGTMRSLMVNPKLWRGYFKPLYRKMFTVVHNTGRHVFFHSDGYIMTCNYEAREFGVRSGVPISRAWKRCPTAATFDPIPLYMKTSSEIMKTLRKALAKEIKKEIPQNQLARGQPEESRNLTQQLLQMLASTQILKAAKGVSQDISDFAKQRFST